MTPPHAIVPYSEAHRDRAVRTLCAAYAHDALSLEQLDARLAAVYQARSAEAVQGALVAPWNAAETLERWLVRVAAPGTTPERGVAVAVAGGFDVGGGWHVPRELRVWAVAGGGDLDLREAVFAPGLTTIHVTAITGGVDIKLPECVRVEVVGAAFGGAFEFKAGIPVDDPYVPLVRVTGTALLAGVTVQRERAEFPSERNYLVALSRAAEIQRSLR